MKGMESWKTSESSTLVKNSILFYGIRLIRAYLPAISWKVLVIIKSVWFMAIRSAVN